MARAGARGVLVLARPAPNPAVDPLELTKEQFDDKKRLHRVISVARGYVRT